jgi:hypothetical protein
MRTTLTLDSDVTKLLEKKSRSANITYKQVVNDALRRGFGVKEATHRPYQPLVFDMGGTLVDLTKANSLIAQLDDQDFVANDQKLRALPKSRQKKVPSK